MTAFCLFVSSSDVYAPSIRNLLDGSKHNVSTRRSRSLSRIYSKPNTEVIFHCIIILYGTSRLINHGVQLSYTKDGYSWFPVNSYPSQVVPKPTRT